MLQGRCFVFVVGYKDFLVRVYPGRIMLVDCWNVEILVLILKMTKKKRLYIYVLYHRGKIGWRSG